MCEFIKICLACCTLIALKVHQVSRCVVDTIKCLNDAWCCLPCNAVMAVKEWCDNCHSKVGVENDTNTNDVQMAGDTPADIAMV